MSPDRLNELTVMSIENLNGRSLNYDQLINDFAYAKGRRKPLGYFFFQISLLLGKFACLQLCAL